jgi:hypothetical protein
MKVNNTLSSKFVVISIITGLAGTPAAAERVIIKARVTNQYQYINLHFSRALRDVTEAAKNVRVVTDSG